MENIVWLAFFCESAFFGTGGPEVGLQIYQQQASSPNLEDSSLPHVIQENNPSKDYFPYHILPEYTFNATTLSTILKIKCQNPSV